MATYNWIGGGGSTDWNDGSNWAGPNGANTGSPSTGDDAVVDTTDTITGPGAADDLDLVDAPTLAGDVTVQTAELNGAQVDLTGSLTTTTALTVDAGAITVEVGADLNTSNGSGDASATIDGGYVDVDSGNFEGAGVTVGDTSQSELDIEAGALATFTQPSTGVAALALGSQASGDGVVDVDDSTLTTGAITVGVDGSGTMQVDDGSAVMVSDNDPAGFAGVGLAENVGSDGSLTLSDMSSITVQAGAFNDGFDGDGTVEIDGGSTLSLDDTANGSLTIGSEADGTGDLSITDAGSALTVAAALVVGNDGVGALEADSGASVTANSVDVAAGDNDTPSGITLDGAGTTLTVTDSFTVGDAGTGTLAATDGAVIMASSLDVAAQITSGDTTMDTPSTVSLDGDGTKLTVTGAGFIGDGGYGGLSITGGAMASFDSLVVASQNSSGDPDPDNGVPSYIDVDGAGAMLTVTYTLFVGDAGYGYVDIVAGATVTADSLVVANQDTSGEYGELHATDTGVSGSPSGVFVNGPTSVLTITGNAFVGDGGYGYVHLIDGASMTAGFIDIADAATSGDPAALDPSFVEVEGEDSSLTVSGDVTVGDAGYGALTDLSGGATTIGGSLDIGKQASSGSLDDPGSAYPSLSFVGVDDGSTLKVAGSTIIGDAGDGAFVLSNGGVFTTEGSTLEVGSQAGGNGELFVYDDNTTLDFAGGLNLGDGGTGTASDEEGSTLTIGEQTTLGVQDGGDGTLNVDGDGSTAGLAGITVGNEGTGLVSLTTGGALSTDGLTIGAEDGSMGTVTVADTESSLDVGGDLVVGGSGTGVLTDDGPLTVDGTITIGAESSGTGTLTFNGTEFTSDKAATVGDAGNGLLIVQQGAAATFDSVEIASAPGSAGEVDVNAATLTTADDITVGDGGGGTLKLTASATLNTGGDATVGGLASGSVQSATVDTASIWAINGSLTIGDDGIGSVTVQGEAQAGVTGDVTLGAQDGASGVVTVTGSTSSSHSNVAYGGMLTVGANGDGSLSVLAGGQVAPSASGTGVIEIGAGATGSGMVTVSGTASELTGTVLAVGGTQDAAGGMGQLTVGSGGVVSAADIVVWGGGTIALQGGSVETDPITVYTGGTLSGYGAVSGDVTDDGTITTAGGVLKIANEMGGSGTVGFAGESSLSLSDLASDSGGLQTQDFDVTITAFGPGDTIEIAKSGLGAYGTITSAVATQAGANTNLALKDGGATVATLVLAGSYLLDNFTVALDPAAPNEIDLTVACFCRGTLILTERGEIPVEDLSIGGILVTASGEHRPIKWIGRRSYAGRFLTANPNVQPIRFRAGSLGDGLPRRDLLVSPEHAMFLDGMLIPARCLVNGRSIVPERNLKRVDYFHIELDSHDVLLAEGAPSETFVDDDSRGVFHNATEFGALYPDTPQTKLYCAPKANLGFELEAIRRRLVVVAGDIGQVA
jgi:T5SS/PEP-CTERM-associated repeat protein